jgi:hypothetical protein
MARRDGRHRVTRRTKIATGIVGLALAASGVAVATTAGEPGNASADPVDKAFFVDITTVAPNVKAPRNQRGASTGTFTVDCGENQNGHFNPDNFIAQPGIKNGAQHLHDYVGNLTTNADSTNESLLAGGTTCKNGDQSAYFWPVVRIDRGDGAAATTTTAAGGSATDGQSATTTTSPAAPATGEVDCPDVVSQLPTVPDQAMAEVTDNVNQLDQQVAEANQRLVSTQGQGGANFVQNAILGPLRDKRTAVINRIATAIGRFTQKPPLDTGGLAGCTVATSGRKGGGRGIQGSGGSQGKGGGKGGNGGATTTTTPAAGTTTTAPASTSSAADSTTSTTSAAASTTTLAGPSGADQEVGINDGTIIEPESAAITFRGSPVSKVTAMPQFLRALSGDAKPAINGTANARAAWTCTGHENTILAKYPICPAGTKVERIHDFPSCWDGKNIDSANHRTHIVFPDANGRCQNGFKAVPQLRITLVYDIPLDVQQNGEYKVDSFAEEHHDPLSDHDDFGNVMSQRLMWRLVNCINTGRICNE